MKTKAEKEKDVEASGEETGRLVESRARGNTSPFIVLDFSVLFVFFGYFWRLTLVCEDVMLPECTPRMDFWLLCGVPLRGETYGRGDDASDVRETGD